MNPQLEPQQAMGESVLCLIEPALSHLQCVDETFSGVHGGGQECTWHLRQREAPVPPYRKEEELVDASRRIRPEVISRMDQKLYICLENVAKKKKRKNIQIVFLELHLCVKVNGE